jgi:protocatechuate 3,4-dioxygenase beta subunit
MRCAPATAAAVLVACSLVLEAQAPPRPLPGAPSPGPPVPGAPVPGVPGVTPPRDATGGPRTGTSVLRGRVLALDTGLPLRRAQVRVGAPDAGQNRLTMTDDQGRFEIRDLPAARYSLSVTRGGYVTLNYGQRRPFEPGRPIELADGEVFDDITMHLPPGGVIAGRVVDEIGEPITGAQVQASRYRYVNGQRVLASVNTGVSPLGFGTDDRGEFRLFGLPPGDYIVNASMNMPLAPGGATDTSVISYAPTYYPGSVSAAGAQMVTVGMGEEVLHLTLQMVPSRTATITGRVIDENGAPFPQAQLSLREVLSGGTGMRSRGVGTTAADGSFTVTGVTPGEYHLDARGPSTPPLGLAGAPAGSMEVIVSGEDVSGLLIAVSSGVTVRGRIVAAGGRPPEGLRTSDVRIPLQPFPPGMGAFPGGGTVTVADDWTFEGSNMQGQRLLRPTMPQGWALRRVLHQGVDVTDTPINFSRGPVDDLVVEITQDLTSLDGRVQDARGTLVTDYVVVIFAEDSARWAPPSRFIRTARPDQGGLFRTGGLPPGQYVAAALEYLEPGEETNPALLGQLLRAPGATRFSLREGQSQNVTLRVLDTF